LERNPEETSAIDSKLLDTSWREYEQVEIDGGLFDSWVNFDDKYSEDNAMGRDLYCILITVKGERKPGTRQDTRAVSLILEATNRRGFFRRCRVFFFGFFVILYPRTEKSLGSIILEPMPLDKRLQYQSFDQDRGYTITIV